MCTGRVTATTKNTIWNDVLNIYVFIIIYILHIYQSGTLKKCSNNPQEDKRKKTV